MRIDSWSLDRVMQLPDHLFGRRWPVCLYAISTEGVTRWDISELGLPERCVLWEVVFWPAETWVDADRFRLALGDQLPTTTAIMDGFEPLIHGLGVQGRSPREIVGAKEGSFAIRRIRKPIEAAGRRVVLEVSAYGATTISLSVAMVFSSIPREVPDWLISDQVKNL